MSEGPRLLPWSGSAGQRLFSSSGPDSVVWRVADEMEAVQLRMGSDFLEYARALLDERAADEQQLRFVVHRLSEALTDALRIAESREMRLAAEVDAGAPADQPGPHGSDQVGAEREPS